MLIRPCYHILRTAVAALLFSCFAEMAECRAQSCGVWAFSDAIYSIADEEKTDVRADSFNTLEIAKEKMCVDGRNADLSFSVIPGLSIGKIGKSLQIAESSAHIQIFPGKILFRRGRQDSEYSNDIFLKLSGIPEIIRYHLSFQPQSHKTERHVLCYLPGEYSGFSCTEFISRNAVFYSYTIPPEKKEQTVSAIYSFLAERNAEKCKNSESFADGSKLPAGLAEKSEVFFVDDRTFLLFMETNSDSVRISYYIRPFNVKK